MKRRILIVPVLLLLILSQTACPSSSDITKMAKASNELAHDTVTIEKTVAAFYQAKKISKPRKDDYADNLKKVAVDGKKFNDLLTDLDKQYPEGTLPPDKVQLVKDNWRPLASLIASIVTDLGFDGLKNTDLEKHANTISGVVK